MAVVVTRPFRLPRRVFTRLERGQQGRLFAYRNTFNICAYGRVSSVNVNPHYHRRSRILHNGVHPAGPGGARRGQAGPGGARRGQAGPGGARRGQAGPGGAREGAAILTVMAAGASAPRYS
ncbi:hypothetical protein EYF80_065086 [Liparis tanakae]|uniref:Uncharacterized protein n=1 Tax=Liparis tanakae TaxID=230148 RepID=A0A4Z2E7J8_9TELE|nr:hypothetical protein EYF80_065086 [Liparis tanakae]